MPIRIPSDLPAYDILRAEGVNIMSEETANRQEVRPLQIGLLNLMPKKEQTETQFARLIAASPIQIELTLIRMTEHVAKNTSAKHMESFYHAFQDIKHRNFDGLIITGAPIEHLPFEEVSYWDEMQEVFNWTQTNVLSTFGVCWGGMAMIYHMNGVPKHMTSEKQFGCFRHRNLAPASHYLRGFSDDFSVPVSRWTEVRDEDLVDLPNLETLMHSDEVGPCLIEDTKHRALYIFNHLEYDSNTLKEEYDRDVDKGKAIDVPKNYYPNDDPAQQPENRWRSHAHLLYGNWINEIYQTTNIDLDKMLEGDSK